MDDLTKMTPEELANWQSQWKPHSPHYILAEKEWQRRERLHQHELDLELIQKQVKWMKFSAVIGFLGVIIGAIITVSLSKCEPFTPQQSVLPKVQKETNRPPLIQQTIRNGLVEQNRRRQ